MRVFSLLLLLVVITVTELTVMIVLAPWFALAGPVLSGAVDAVLLSLFCAVPLWFFFSAAWSGGDPQRRQEIRQGIVGLICKLVSVVFCAELAITVVLPSVLGDPGPRLRGVVDTVLIISVSAPMLWWLLLRFEKRFRLLPTDPLENPVLLYVWLLYTVFLADLLQELLLPLIPFVENFSSFVLIDALGSTLIIAPFLWIFVARPLRRSVLSEKARARAVYDQVVDAVVIVNDSGRIESLNPAATRIFGYARDELAGKPVSLLLNEDQIDADWLLQHLPDEQTAALPQPTVELNVRSRDGRSLVVDMSINPIEFGRRRDLLLILRDITERREAERALRESDIRFREVYEQSEDAILFFKPETAYVIDANLTTERLFGFSKEELRGEGFACLFNEEDLATVTSAVRELEAGNILQLDYLLGRRRDGTPCVISLRGKFMTLQGVSIIYCTLRDVSDRIRLEKEARDIQSRLIQANKMTSLGLLVSGVAHEINNPNNYIMANAQLLTDSWEDVRKVLRDYADEHGEFFIAGLPFAEMDRHAPELLAGIIDGSRRINDIVSSLKQVARPERNELIEGVDLNQVATTAVTIVQHELVHSTESFQLELAGNLPKIRGNAQQLGQVIINLLMNACQALPSRAHGIRLATADHPASQLVTIEVRDEGTGISREDSSRIMDPFFTTKLDSGGTGLGLSICRSIVREHKGHLDFTSVPGAGTTFVVSLPYAVAEKKDNA